MDKIYSFFRWNFDKTMNHLALHFIKNGGEDLLTVFCLQLWPTSYLIAFKFWLSLVFVQIKRQNKAVDCDWKNDETRFYHFFFNLVKPKQTCINIQYIIRYSFLKEFCFNFDYVIESYIIYQFSTLCIISGFGLCVIEFRFIPTQ